MFEDAGKLDRLVFVLSKVVVSLKFAAFFVEGVVFTAGKGLPDTLFLQPCCNFS
jgi:hypothetical protein